MSSERGGRLQWAGEPSAGGVALNMQKSLQPD